MYAVLRITLIVVIAAFPLAARKQLEALDWRYTLPFLALTGLLAGVEFLYDREKEERSKKELEDARNDLEEVRRRLERQRERGLSMAHLMSVVVPAMLKLEKFIEGVHDQLAEDAGEHKKPPKASPAEIRQFVREGIEASDQVIIALLKAVGEEVRAYWNLEADSVKCNLMVARRVTECGPREMARLKGLTGLKGREFLEYGREPESYEYLLELTLWGVQDPEVPPLVLPVESAASKEGTEHLIPGAPTALALHKDVVVEDTKEISKNFSAQLEKHVKDNILAYFHGKQVRSFMCMELRDGEQPIGVLNIQSTVPRICGPFGQETTTLVKSIDHYRFCLVQLVNSQKKLRKAAE